MTAPNRFARVALWLATAVLGGCVVVPYPAPTRTRARGVVKNAIDLRFLTVGATTRAEVLNAVGAFETGASADRFLWCRWELSKAGIAGGAAGGAAIGPKRIWLHRNLVAVFDANQTLEWFRLRPDGELAPALWEGTGLAGYQAPESLQFPFYSPKTVYLDETYEMGTATVENGVFRRRLMGERKAFTAPVRELRDIALGGTEDETDLRVNLRFAGGKSVKIGAEPIDLVRLMVALRKAGFSGPAVAPPSRR